MENKLKQLEDHQGSQQLTTDAHELFARNPQETTEALSVYKVVRMCVLQGFFDFPTTFWLLSKYGDWAMQIGATKMQKQIHSYLEGILGVDWPVVEKQLLDPLDETFPALFKLPDEPKDKLP